MNNRVVLTIQGGDQPSNHTIDIDDLNSYLIGRGTEADLFIGDLRISRKHCRLLVEAEKLLLEPLSKTGPTILNGAPITAPNKLSNGDVITIGTTNIRVAFLGAPSDSVVEAKTIVNVVDPQQTVLHDGDTPDAPLMAHGSAVVGSDTIAIGRQASANVVLDHLLVSRFHAKVYRANGDVLIEDLKSSNGTFVNGERIEEPQPLRKGAIIDIGPFQFSFDGSTIKAVTRQRGARVATENLGKLVADRTTGSDLWLLKEIGITIEPGEFIGLMGASGSGKSTFMDTINGRRPATHGRVLHDGENLYKQFDSLKASIGYVPQEVIFHQELTLVDALRFTSRLRLSNDTTDEEINNNIDDVLETVGLSDRRKTRIRDLSGGQKKRVSIAMELLCKPRTLFLDEVTSGLDLGTEKLMMQLFRKLADEGITVICITHFVDSLDMCDAVAYFGKGRLLFYGLPADIREFFEVEKISDVYAAETEHSTEDWLSKFTSSDSYEHFIRTRAANMPAEKKEAVRATNPVQPAEIVKQLNRFYAKSIKPIAGDRQQLRRLLTRSSDFKRQLSVFTQRYIKTLLSDRTNLALLISLAPAVAILLCILGASIDSPTTPFYNPDQEEAARNEQYAFKQTVLSFGAILTLFFLALFGSIREIVKELTIYRHERFINLQILPYFLSKVFALSCLGLIQTTLVLAILTLAGGLNAGNPIQQFAILYTVSLAGMSLGLAISAAVKASDWAVMIMFAVVIPQILFAGAIVTVSGLAELIAQTTIVCYWSLEAFKGIFPQQVTDNETWVPQFIVVALHILLYSTATLYFLAKKDGPGVLKNYLAEIVHLQRM